MSREELSAELASRFGARGWLSRLEGAFKGRGGHPGPGGWEPDTEKNYWPAFKLRNTDLDTRLGTTVWRSAITPRVLRFNGQAGRGLTLTEVREAHRALDRDPLGRAAFFYGTGVLPETGEWCIPETLEAYLAQRRGFGREAPEISSLGADLRAEWAAIRRLSK
jgi:hypothetical protein